MFYWFSFLLQCVCTSVRDLTSAPALSLQGSLAPLRVAFILSLSHLLPFLCVRLYLKPVTPHLPYFPFPPSFTVSCFGSVPTSCIFLYFIPFVSLIRVPSFVCLFLPLHLSPSVLPVVYFTLYTHSVCIFIFSSLHFTYCFPFCTTPFTAPGYLTFLLIESCPRKASNPLPLHRGRPIGDFTLSLLLCITGSGPVKCKIPRTYHLSVPGLLYCCTFPSR